MEVEGLEITKLASSIRCRSLCQWEGVLTDKRAIYIRWKHGELSVSLSGIGGSLDDAIDADPIFERHIGRDYEDGVSLEEVKRITGLSGPKKENINVCT